MAHDEGLIGGRWVRKLESRASWGRRSRKSRHCGRRCWEGAPHVWLQEWAAEKGGRAGGHGVEGVRESKGWCVAHTRRGGAFTHTHTHTHTHTSDGLRAVASGKHFIKLNYFT